jgi:hypothetical protein
MRLKLYCNRYKHFKDALVCSVSCAYRTRCKDFALFYDQHRAETDALVKDYYEVRDARRAVNLAAMGDTAEPVKRDTKRNKRASDAAVRVTYAPLARVVELSSLVHLEVKRVMSEATYIWISKDDQAEVLEHEEVIRRAERGAKAKSIFKVAQEMELKFQLVPRRGIDKAKRAVAAAAQTEADRAAARRSSRPRLLNQEIEPTTPVIPLAAPEHNSSDVAATPRRTRVTRLAKAVGEK